MSLYELSTISAEEFAQDPYIAIPFFQRKSTWTPGQRLGLALSVFRGYPIGTVVVKETDSQVFLLDGRQRRETLQAILNPATLFVWAQSELRIEANEKLRKLKANEWADRALVIRAFREYADRYFFGELRIETEPGSDETGPADELEQDAESAGTETPDTGIDMPDEDPDPAAQLHPELRDLFEIVWLGRTVDTAAGRKPYLATLFDYSGYVDQLDWIHASGELSGQTNTPRLVERLREEKNAYLKANQVFPPPEDQIALWITSRLIAPGHVTDDEGFKTFMQPSHVIDALSALDRLDRSLRGTSLGYVKIRPEAQEADDMKVFSLINTAGTQLTGPEVLCATPSWNTPITNPPAELQEARNALHQAKGAAPAGPTVRKWDKAATMLDRVHAPLAYGAPDQWTWESITSKTFDDKINLGFRLLAGHADGKMMKNDLAQLAQSAHVAWDTTGDEKLLNESYKAAVGQPFFQFLGNWGFIMRTRMSEYLAHAFLLLGARDYKFKGDGQAPTAGVPFRLFRRNALIRFDRLVFEYVTGTWGHAADSRVARELRSIRQKGDEDGQFVETSIPATDWESLLVEVQEGMIMGESYTERGPDPRIVLLLYYASAIEKQSPNPLHEAIQVDHIIPQALFGESQDSTLSSNENHIGNLALLNASVNNYKKDRRLNQINDVAKQQEISRLTAIPVDQLSNFVSVDDSPQLIAFRGGQIAETLNTRRVEMLKDPRKYFDPQQG